jgi:hypothetical protein
MLCISTVGTEEETSEALLRGRVWLMRRHSMQCAWCSMLSETAFVRAQQTLNSFQQSPAVPVVLVYNFRKWLLMLMLMHCSCAAVAVLLGQCCCSAAEAAAAADAAERA